MRVLYGIFKGLGFELRCPTIQVGFRVGSRLHGFGALRVRDLGLRF